MIETTQRDNVLVVQVHAWDEKAADELAETWERLEDEEDIIGAVVDLSGIASVEAVRSLDWPALPLSTSKPVIAAIEGDCYGHDFELALACDLRVAVETARFGLPGRNAAYSVASVLLPRSTGVGLSLNLLLSGQTASASEMAHGRLVHRIVADGEVLSSSIEMVKDLIARLGSPESLQKRMLLDLSGLPLPYVMSRVRAP